MSGVSKELLDQSPKTSVFENLVLNSKDRLPKSQRNKHRVVENDKGRPLTTEVPKSQVLGKVKDFLGIMAKANEKLQLSAQGNSRINYDIEVLNGNEKEYIELDLLVGVADLHTPEAITAAEAAIGGFQPSVSLASTSCSDTEDDSDDDDDDDDDDGKQNGDDERTTCPLEKPDSVEDLSLQGNKPNKRPKIVVLN